ncbi:MAG TPA: GNAT family N-acetyltransferase [Candidatus Limnocylindrales bacterium]|jgi:aminoglycoside 2'-N-acetyltransferase I
MPVRSLPSAALTDAQLRAIRALMDAAFEDFTDDDMDHGLGGRHFLLQADGELVAHASVVERALELDGRRLRAGYVEAVAVAPARQRQGLGTEVMVAATGHIRETYELGALGTGEQPFYEPLGWERWAGRSFVRERDGTLRRTADEEPWLMVLRTGPSAALPLTGSLTCEWREGDVW